MNLSKINTLDDLGRIDALSKYCTIIEDEIIDTQLNYHDHHWATNILFRIDVSS